MSDNSSHSRDEDQPQSPSTMDGNQPQEPTDSTQTEGNTPEKDTAANQQPQLSTQTQKAELKKQITATKKQARKDQQAEKKAELTATKTATPGLDTATHFIGYTIVTVSLPHLGGKGPNLVPLEGLRPLAAANVSALVAQAGQDMEGLGRLDPNHALSIALDPSLLDSRCLRKDETGPFTVAVFQPGAHDKEAKLLAGQHRIAAVARLLKSQLSWLKDVRQSRVGNPANDVDLQKEEEKVHGLLTTNGIWLVKMYNLVSIQRSEHHQSILLKLSTNNLHQSFQDQPEQLMTNVLIRMKTTTSEADRQSVYKELTHIGNKSGGADVKWLFGKYRDLTGFMEELYQLPIFHNTLKPKVLLGAKQVVWGMVLPFLESNWFLIRFLCSYVSWDEEELVFGDLYSAIKAELDQEPPQSFSPTIANKLIQIFDRCYVDHLKNKMGFFGRNSPAWEEDYTLYFDDITKSVKEFVAAEKEHLLVYTQTEIQILGRLEDALLWTKDRFSDEPLFSPPNIGSIPFLSPGMVSGLLDSLHEVEAGYTLIFTSITPGITLTMGSQRQGGVNFKNFYSQSEVFFHNLEYWAGFGVVTDWSFKSAIDNPSHLATFTALKHNIISVLLLARIDAFANLGLINHILSNAPTGEDEKETTAEKKAREKLDNQEMQKTMKKIFDSTRLEQWEQENVKNYAAYHNQQEPSRMEWSVRHVPQPSCFPHDTLAPVFTGLSHTHFNWMTASNRTNHVEHRKRIVKAIVREEYYWTHSRREAIEDNAALMRLFSQLHHTITSVALFEKWDFWLVFIAELETMPNGIGTQEEEEDLDQKIQDQVIRAYQAEKKKKLQKIYQDLVKNLNQAGLCGISDEDGGILLHPGLERPLLALEKTMLNVQKDLHRAKLGEVFKSHFQILEQDEEEEDSEYASWLAVKEIYGPCARYPTIGKKRKRGTTAEDDSAGDATKKARTTEE